MVRLVALPFLLSTTAPSVAATAIAVAVIDLALVV